MQKEDIEYLNQLVSTLDESVLKLEVAHEKKDSQNFDKIRKFMKKIFEKISEITK